MVLPAGVSLVGPWLGFGFRISVHPAIYSWASSRLSILCFSHAETQAPDQRCGLEDAQGCRKLRMFVLSPPVWPRHVQHSKLLCSDTPAAVNQAAGPVACVYMALTLLGVVPSRLE